MALIAGLPARFSNAGHAWRDQASRRLAIYDRLLGGPRPPYLSTPGCCSLKSARHATVTTDGPVMHHLTGRNAALVSANRGLGEDELRKVEESQKRSERVKASRALVTSP